MTRSGAVLPLDPDIIRIRRLVKSEMRRWLDHEDAEDIAQEAVIETWRQLPRLQGRYALATVVRVCVRSAFTGWIRSRRARRQWRPVGRRPAPTWEWIEELSPDDEPVAFDSIEAALERIAAIEVAGRALAAMTHRQADLVRRTVMEDRPVRQVAALLCVAPKTVWVLKERGLARARRALQKIS